MVSGARIALVTISAGPQQAGNPGPVAIKQLYNFKEVNLARIAI
jgi:hypothetical protein